MTENPEVLAALSRGSRPSTSLGQEREAWRPDLEAAPDADHIGPVFSGSLLQDQRYVSEYLLRNGLVYEKKGAEKKFNFLTFCTDVVRTPR